MDNVKLMLFLIVLILDVVACSKKSEQAPECTPMASAYQVEFPDQAIRKASVESCGGLKTATALDQSGETVTAISLTIELRDPKTGQEYLTLL